MRYLGGYEDRSVRPERQVTRAEAAAIVYRLLEDPEAGTGSCSYADVNDSDWFAINVRALCRLGLFDDGTAFRPNEAITRAEMVDLLTRLAPETAVTVSFSDVPADYWAAEQIGIAASLGWVGGYEDGTFRPENGLTRAEACSIINRVTGRYGDTAQAQKLMGLGLYTDMTASHWAAITVAEASVAHENVGSGAAEIWSGVALGSYTFMPGVHEISGQLYSVDRYGKLALNKNVGAYWADANGVLTQTASSYQQSYVPYISQIDNIYAWVGCEPVSALMGLKTYGYAQDVHVTTFLNNLPFSSSNPEWGFVGSPYVVDNSLRTTIYPAALAEYCNSYCNGAEVCADFRGASVEELRQELLAGNMVVAYETLWWEQPRYRNYWIDGQLQSLVYNNHAILVPMEATTQVQDKYFVYKVDGNGKVHYTEVTVDPQNDGNNYIITSGLKMGDRIVVKGLTGLTDGQEIKALTLQEYEAAMKNAAELGAKQGSSEGFLNAMTGKGDKK